MLVIARGAVGLLMFAPILPASGYEGIAFQFIAATWIQRDPSRPRAWPIDHSYIFALFAFPIYMVVTRKVLGLVWSVVILAIIVFAYGFPLIIVS
jgi:hypothetical protein